MLTTLDKLPIEERLLLLASSHASNGSRLESIQNCAGSVTNWERFVWLANEHGLIALVYHTLKSLNLISQLPEKQYLILHTSFLASLGRNTIIYKTFYEVAEVAGRAGIKVVPIKGLLLEKQIFGDKGLRQMNDLDILVASKDAMELRNLLMKEGFMTIPFISPIHSAFLHPYGKHMPEMTRNGLTVEIHYRLFRDRNNMLTSMMVSSACEVFPGGYDNVLMPGVLLHFLYLAKHLAWHEHTGSSQLRLYVDLAFLINNERDSILTDDLYRLADEANMGNDLKRVLFLLDRYFSTESGAPLPDEPDRCDERFLSFLQNPKKNHPEEHEGEIRSQLNNIDGLFHKVLFVIGMIVPSLTFMKWRYNSRSGLSAIAYYPYRWWIMLKKIAS